MTSYLDHTMKAPTHGRKAGAKQLQAVIERQGSECLSQRNGQWLLRLNPFVDTFGTWLLSPNACMPGFQILKASE